MIGLEGNKDPDLDELTRNERDLVVLEDREFGNTGRVKLRWDKHTGIFEER
jgi:twinkle protein